MVSCRLDESDEVTSASEISGEHLRDCRSSRPFPVFQYLQKFGDRRICGRRSAMRLAGDMHEILNAKTESPRDTVLGTWI